MKKITLNAVTIVCITIVNIAHAQIGIGTTSPDLSSALDVTSTNSGILIPRISLLNNTDAVTIPAPATSLLVYNNGFAPNGFYYWDGALWVQLAAATVSSDWALTGNTSTIAGTNYLGTTDAVDIRFKTGATDRWNISHANNGQLQSYSLGTATAPTYSFQSDQNTGVFSSAADALDITTGGTARIRFPNTNQVHALNIGTAALPFYSFSADPNTGIFSSGTDAIDFATNGTAKFRIPNADQVHALSLGTAALPFYTFSADSNTGIFSSGADALDITTGGTARFRFPNANQVHALSLGTAALPFYSFSADTNTGIYSPLADNLSFTTAGTEQMRIEADGDVGIGAVALAPAKLDITATNKGLLIPRVALTAKNAAGPITAPVTSLLVYNTATAGASPNNVIPGFYYWNGAAWVGFTGSNSNDWSITGNSGTGAANYVGTSDAVDFKIASNGTQRIRVLSNGQVVVNNTGAPFASDRFSVYNTATSDYAINGYSTLTGTGVYGQNTGSGSGVFGLNNSSGQAVRGANTGTGIGVLGTTTNALGTGVFGQANVASGVAVYGTTNGTSGIGVFGNSSNTTSSGVYGQSAGTSGIGVEGFANNTTSIGTYGESSGTNGTGVFGYASAVGGDGVYGQATQPTRFGVWGVNNNATGIGVYGSTTGTTGTAIWGNATGTSADAVFGTASGASGFGTFGLNSNTTGTGVVGAGNNVTASYLANGSGGAFTGSLFGSLSYSTTTANGVGIAAAGNNTAITSFDANGAGGAFTGNQWGTTSIATITGAGNDGIDRAVLAGTYISGGSTSDNVYLGARIGGVNYKILGTGGGSVSTTMKTSQGEKILFAPEAPENWFFDIGEVELINGIATVQLDPTFVETISDSKPFKVFVQGGENTLGSIRITRNQNDKSFIVEDLGGPSNGTVQYNIYAIWKGKENIRFPELKEENRPKPIQQESVTIERNQKSNSSIKSDKGTKLNADIESKQLTIDFAKKVKAKLLQTSNLSEETNSMSSEKVKNRAPKEARSEKEIKGASEIPAEKLK